MIKLAALVCVGAIVLDYVLGEPHRWHPLVGFGWLARGVENIFYGPQELNPWIRQLLGSAAVLLLVAPPVILAWKLSAIPYLGILVELGLVYLALGASSLVDHANAVTRALQAGNLEQAREEVGKIVGRETELMDETEVSLATVESVLENGCDAVFGTLFWFLVAGAPGVVAYRLINTLDAMWGYRTSRYLNFGWAAARLDDVLNWIPARLTALTYTLLGDRHKAWRCWQNQGHLWKSPNAGRVMAAGAGALNLELGGAARYGGYVIERPPLGLGGLLPSSKDIGRALSLVRGGLLLWAGLILLGGWLLA